MIERSGRLFMASDRVWVQGGLFGPALSDKTDGGGCPGSHSTILRMYVGLPSPHEAAPGHGLGGIQAGSETAHAVPGKDSETGRLEPGPDRCLRFPVNPSCWPCSTPPETSDGDRCLERDPATAGEAARPGHVIGKQECCLVPHLMT